MKYNFTESGVPIPIKGYSQQHKSNKDDTILELVQKIVNVISLFFKPKNSLLSQIMPKESMTVKPHEKLYAENSLQEYFIDKYPLQLNIDKVKSVPADLLTNQDLTMNKPSLSNNSTVKEYHLGSHFDNKLKRWTPSFSSPKRIEGNDDYPKNSIFKGFATTILLVLISVLGVLAQTSIDLSLRKTIDKSLPTLNESVKYTLWLKNSGPSVANSIVVQDNFPIDGAVLNTHTGGANFTYSPATGIGTWNVATLAVGDSVKLEINATVTQQGVFFNTAEVFSVGAGQEDTDSSPNNSKLYEDDIAAACFSVPLHWYPGEEYTVSVPAPYKYGSTIKWFNGTTEITPNSTVAVVNADSSLTIKAPGTFTFTTNVSNCPAQGCCAVQVIEGPYGSIGDYVWKDINNDGKQGSTATEPPVAGVKVYLLSASGTKLDSTLTDAQGKYLFDSLTTDSYRVQFVKPGGYDSFTTQNLGTDDTKDSDAGTTGLSQLINIDTSKLPSDTLRNNLNIDAGLKPNYGSIGDYVWSDVNNNGQQDSGEAPISGVKVYLLSASNIKLDSTFTNSNGLYLFDSLASGSYKIQFVAPTGSIAAKQNTGTDATDSDANKNGMSQLISIDITKPSTDTLRNNPNIDAGFVPVGSIGDYVFNDNNGDGSQNTGDTPVVGTKVYLLDANTGAKLDSAITDAQGKYLFDSLLNGNYKVKFVIPIGSSITGKTLGGDPTKDSDANPDGTTDVISINTSLPVGNVGRNNTTVDAGIKTTFGSIGDYVWNDSNNNGLQDATETGVSGIIVELYTSDSIGLPVGSALKKDTTDAGGKYLFTGLSAGNYVVKVVTSSLPSGSQLTTKQDIGTNDAIDSDLNPSTGLSDKIVIDPYDATKKDILTVDGGVYSPLGSIGDFVWKDTNNNGLQDTGELGAEGIKLELYASDALGNPIGAAINTATTNTSGFYTFNNLLKGDYVVRIVASTLPATYLLSNKVDAGDDTKDSDFNPTSGYSAKISIDPFVSVLKDNPTIDGAIYLPIVCAELVAIAVDADICSGDTTSIRGTIAGGGSVRWYLTPTGGTPLATVNSGVAYAVFPTTTTVYYAEIVNAPEGCPNTRQPVAVVVNVRPANPSCVGAVEECIGKTINLNNFIINAITTPGGSFEWHTTANPSSPLVTNPTAVGNGTYYLFEKSGAGCYSNPTLLKVILKNCDKSVDLSLTKTTDNTTPNVGDNITFTIKVTNAGPDAATAVEVTDELPAGLQFVSSAFFTNNSGVLTSTISNVAANQTITLTYIAKVIGSAAITNFAQITKITEKDVDSTPNNGKTTKEDDDDKIVITPKVVELLADLSLNKTVSNSTPTSGDQITYFVEVKNNGTSNATNVEATDIVPAGLQIISATGGDLITTTGNTVVAKFNQINVGQTATFQIVAKVTATTGTIKNWAEVTKSDQKDPNSTPNNGTDKNENDDDDADITIKQPVCNPTTPLIACANPYICLGESVSIEAIGCNGTVVWSDGQTGNTIIVTPTATTTYTAQCKINDNCISPKSNPVQVVVNVIAPPLLTSNSTTNVICNGGSVTLTANNCTGRILWSTGVTTPSITVSPTTTTSYTATCTKSTCVSSKSNIITVTVGTPTTPPTITADNNSVCAGQSVKLTANGCSGTVVWSNGSTGSSITFTPTSTGTYSAVCKVGECSSNASTPLTITVGGAGTAPTITAPKDGICAGESVTLTASNCTGSLTWSTGATTSSITVSPTSTTTYEATCSVNNCSGKGTKVIIVTPKPATPIVTCGKERICPGESLTFVAHGCEGTVTWSNGVTGATMVVSPTVTTTYTAICTVNGCASNPSKDAVITVINPAPPTITASAETVCSGNSVILTASNCDGSVLWSTGSTAGTISVTPTVATTYTLKCIVEECESSASKTINIGGGQTPIAPIISTNKTAVCGNETATLTATGCTGGTITWSNGATGSSINVSTGTYTAICKNDCGTSGNSNAIVIQLGNVTPPTISASTTALCETGQVTLTAAGCAGTVIWSNTSTGSSITVSVATTTTFSAACKTATCESGKSNDVIVNVGKPNKPTITGNKGIICAGDVVILTATGCEGTTVWSNGLTGSSISVTPSNTTDYTAVCKLPQGGCTSDQSNKVTITVTPKPESPVISCTASRICKGDTLTLNALGCSGSVLWSTGQTSASINVNPAETTVYTAICKVGSCESAPSAAATITVGNPIPPVVTCKNTQICGGSSTQIEAAGCTGTVKWSDGQIGAVITVSPTSITSYSAICDGGRCQSEKSNVITVQVTGSGLTKPTVRDLVNTCPFVTVDLTTAVTSTASSQGGIFVFRTGTTPGSPAVANPSTTGTGTYYVFEKAGNGCYSEGAKINVNITTCEIVNPSCVTNPATALAGKDTTVCLSADFFTLQGKIGGAASSAKWTTDGKGSFDNALSLNTKYNYSNDDLVKGSVKFTLTTNDPDDNGSCVAATSSFTVTLNGVSTVPTIASDKSANICFGDSVVLTATNTGSYKWSTGATTKSITVKTPGRYTVKLINDNGCASLSSNEIVVKLSDAIAAPTVTAITKNNCPATTVNLASSVTSQTKSTGGAFEFHTGSSPSSPMLANASAVGSGTYYVIEKSGTGCYSPASPIIVTIDQCETTTDTSKVDVSIQIIGSRVELKIGDPVTYTVTVKNNSTVKAATNVNVVNVLPKGLAITSTTPGFTAFGTDSLLSVIGNLPAGATKTYTYDAKTTKAGQIINTAKITKLDQVDPILSNNISQWTVECKECQETCVGLALAADTTRQANGSYNITFRALIEACGNVKLEGVKVTENLATMFPAPTTFTIVQKPTAGIGSKIQTNDSFNGTTDLNLTIPEGSIVEVGKIDTIKFVINIVPNGKEGPFSTNAIVEAIGNTTFGIPQDVSDVSNNGKTVVKESAEPTVVRLYKSPSVGLAKIVLDTTKKANGSYDITYQLLVKNNGSLTLNNVVVRDTLSKVFKAPATFTVVAAPSKNTSSQLTLNSAFNGTTDTRLTLTGSSIAIGKTDTLKFTINVQPDTLKAFANTAVVSGSGTLTSGTTENVTDLSNAGLNPDAPGSNPTNLNLNSEGGSSIEVPCIGIALYVKDTVRQADSSYNITYKAILKNCGNLNLSSIQVCDTLSKTFTSPAVAKLAVKPTVSAGSLLKIDTSYNGISKTCMLLDASQLAPNKIDTITWVVNVKLNGNKGPFRNNVVVTAKTPSGGDVSDASNAGVNPDPSGNTATVINFNSLPEALIGISKSASEPKLVTGTTNTYDVTFTFKVKNYGKVAFTGVQIQDNLSETFGDSVKVDSVKVTADAGLTVNSSYTGRGSLINLLVDSLSTLAANTERNVTLFTRLTTTSNRANFENQALVIGKYPTNKSVDDLSTNGNDPDPDANGSPKDNSIATPVKLGDGGPIIPSFSTKFGIAKAAILDTVKNADGSYNLSYNVIVKNYGTRKLTNVQLSDSLNKVFADSAEFVIVGKPVLSKNSKLKVDSSFNGRSVTTMLIADSSSLAAGASDTLTFKLRLLSEKKGDATYSNSITGTAKDSTTNVRDISQAGLNPDPDADNNPGNNNQPTVITIKGQTAITDTTNRGIIPQAFSPNSDGKNDLFVIKGINGVNDVEAEIFIYNRWGQLVYQNTDFAKVEGWNGEANNGIVLGNKGVGVPDGTYFICVKAAGFWGNQPKIQYITIAR